MWKQCFLSVYFVDKISVLTITRDRTSHLTNLLKGLAQSNLCPDECIIVHMNEPAQSVGQWPFPCHHYAYQSSASLPLAQARNFAAKQATGEILIFLDVDCIPAPDMIAAYQQGCNQAPASIIMGAVRYLQAAISADWTVPSLVQQSQPNPNRNISNLPTLALESNYGLFWSLSFALRRSVFVKIGGFSECYSGYGAEDTDFAWKARKQNIPLRWMPDAVAFHQYHSSSVPPWQHFADIVGNARTFYERWGEWPMAGWLSTFTQAGCLKWTVEGDSIEIIRWPILQSA